MEPSYPDRPPTESGSARQGTDTSAPTWWRLGAGAALLLTAAGGISPRSVLRALALAGGGTLVYQALTGPGGMFEGRLMSKPSSAARHPSNAPFVKTSETSPSSTVSSSTGRQDMQSSGIGQDEPALAGSEGLAPIDLRGA